MNRFLLKTAISATFLLFVVVGLNSCMKEKPTTATISVIDTAGTIVENASVRLYGTPTVDEEGNKVNPNALDTIWERVYITDFEGKVTFDYTEQFNLGQAGSTVLDIEVFLLNLAGDEDSLIGNGIIKVEPQKENEETVIAFPA